MLPQVLARLGLVSLVNAPTTTLDTTVLIEGILNDQPDPMLLMILSFRPIEQ
jgi:hypothetical protein